MQPAKLQVKAQLQLLSRCFQFLRRRRRAGERVIVAESSSDRNSSFYRGPMHPAKGSQRSVEENLVSFLLSRYRDDDREANWYLQSTILPER